MSELERWVLERLLVVRGDQVNHIGALLLIIVRLDQTQRFIIDLVILVHLELLDFVNTTAQFQLDRELILPVAVEEVLRADVHYVADAFHRDDQRARIRHVEHCGQRPQNLLFY